jgi:hypothetical protein
MKKTILTMIVFVVSAYTIIVSEYVYQPVFTSQQLDADTMVYSAVRNFTVGDTSTTLNAILTCKDSCNFNLQYSVYFNTIWSDTVTVATVNTSTGALKFASGLTTGKLMQCWFPTVAAADSIALKYFKMQGAGWQRRWILNPMTGRPNSGKVSLGELK